MPGVSCRLDTPKRLPQGSVLAEAAGIVMKLDGAREPRCAINALLSEVAGKTVADANVSEPGKVQKKIIHGCPTDEGRERVQGFVPRCMTFPVGHYDPTKTLERAMPSDAIKALFTCA